MSYQVLARKWRPRTFTELVGQEHVARALVNGLDNDRLHHAFLFTGTRGVGKTTIARIFAKALNCETGVGSEPCGQCATCRDVDAGRFVDLIEVDAASRTKVDDTRELLDNVQYAPGRGRFKVYLIDEVHMLSTHSFNALLKTLEEPPPHVKFLLATTDPQKLPVTVLSRCLQFNLKRLQPDQIRGYLERVAGSEGVAFEGEALDAIAAAADGSMRDALSLLDQAIAYGGGALRTDEVRGMLGTVEGVHLEALLDALADRDAGRLWRAIGSLAEFAPDFGAALRDIAALLHQAAVSQVLGAAEDGFVAGLARRMTPEDLQLCYEIAVQGRAGLDLAPDARCGFEMTLLRMLAFAPLADEETGGGAPGPGSKTAAGAGPASARDQARELVRDAARRERGPEAPRQRPAPSRELAAMAAPMPPGSPAPPRPPAPVEAEPPEAPGDWSSLVLRLGLRGPAAMLAANSVLEPAGPDRYRLLVDPEHSHLRTDGAEEKIRTALTRLFGQNVAIEFVEGQAASESPAARQERESTARVERARRAIGDDPLVHELITGLDARLIEDSIRPLDN